MQGLMPTQGFLELIQKRMFFNYEEAQNLAYFYDPMQRQQVKIAEYLTDLRE